MMEKIISNEKPNIKRKLKKTGSVLSAHQVLKKSNSKLTKSIDATSFISTKTKKKSTKSSSKKKSSKSKKHLLAEPPLSPKQVYTVTSDDSSEFNKSKPKKLPSLCKKLNSYTKVEKIQRKMSCENLFNQSGSLNISSSKGSLNISSSKGSLNTSGSKSSIKDSSGSDKKILSKMASLPVKKSILKFKKSSAILSAKAILKNCKSGSSSDESKVKTLVKNKEDFSVKLTLTRQSCNEHSLDTSSSSSYKISKNTKPKTTKKTSLKIENKLPLAKSKSAQLDKITPILKQYRTIDTTPTIPKITNPGSDKVYKQPGSFSNRTVKDRINKLSTQISPPVKKSQTTQNKPTCTKTSNLISKRMTQIYDSCTTIVKKSPPTPLSKKDSGQDSLSELSTKTESTTEGTFVENRNSFYKKDKFTQIVRAAPKIDIIFEDKDDGNKLRFDNDESESYFSDLRTDSDNSISILSDEEFSYAIGSIKSKRSRSSTRSRRSRASRRRIVKLIDKPVDKFLPQRKGSKIKPILKNKFVGKPPMHPDRCFSFYSDEDLSYLSDLHSDEELECSILSDECPTEMSQCSRRKLSKNKSSFRSSSFNRSNSKNSFKKTKVLTKKLSARRNKDCDLMPILERNTPDLVERNTPDLVIEKKKVNEGSDSYLSDLHSDYYENFDITAQMTKQIGQIINSYRPCLKKKISETSSYNDVEKECY